MNFNHVRAVCAGERMAECSVGITSRIVTDCHIMFLDPAGLVQLSGEPITAQANVLATWQRAMAALIPHPLGKYRKASSGHVYRELGSCYLDEAYVRCFPDGSTFYVQDPNTAVRVEHENRTIGLIMPVRHGENADLIEVPSDEVVFAPFANESNDFYLEGLGAMQERRDDLSSEVVQLQERIDELEDERDENIDALDTLQRLIDERLKSAHA